MNCNINSKRNAYYTCSNPTKNAGENSPTEFIGRRATETTAITCNTRTYKSQVNLNICLSVTPLSIIIEDGKLALTTPVAVYN